MIFEIDKNILKQDTCIEVALVQDPEESGSCRKKSLGKPKSCNDHYKGILKKPVTKKG